MFLFFNSNDGYDASRILNESILKEYESKVQGDMTVSVPHQDVLIIGDIRNETGYDVLAQLTMSFLQMGGCRLRLYPLFMKTKSSNRSLFWQKTAEN